MLNAAMYTQQGEALAMSLAQEKCIYYEADIRAGNRFRPLSSSYFHPTPL
jgi:hypothetical protein